MLALRLSGARSIRANPPCCAHVTRAGVNGRGSSSARCAPTSQRRSYASARSETKNDADAAPPPNMNDKAAGSTQPPSLDTMDLIRNSMDLLRRFKENPEQFKAEGEQAGEEQDNGKLRNQKYDVRQNKIFTETLMVLKDALSIHAATTLQNTGSKAAVYPETNDTLQTASAMVQSMLPKVVKAAPKALKESAKPAAVNTKADDNKKKNKKKLQREEAHPQSPKEAASNKTEAETIEQPKSKEPQPKAKKSQPEPSEKQSKDESAQRGAKKEPDPVAEAVTASLASLVNFSQSKPPPRLQKHNSRLLLRALDPEWKQSEQEKPQSGKKRTNEAQAKNDQEVKNEKEVKKGKEPTKNKAIKDEKKEIKDEKKEAKQVAQRPKKKKHNLKVETFRAEPVSAMVPIAESTAVPLIQYGLDRVLFKDGVYPLQDPRTRVWNFDPYLASIMPVSEFDFEALTEYITSSKDQKLIGITKDQKKKYTGSTSSMTSTLAHFHFLLSKWRPITHARLTRAFDLEHESFSGILKAPSAVFLNYNDGVYAIDADKEWDDETILSMLGKSMEKLMTVPKEDFERYHRDRSHQLTAEEKGQEESYHYTAYGDLVMRSQLDAYDPRLPGTGVYDLKTRAVVSIRKDATHPENGVGYEIRQRDGNWDSFEREYADLIRTAFLKYSLQVRMGRMDGIFVAYHNTQRIFGFQYIPLEEMDLAIHGSMDKNLGDMEFTASVKMFNDLINRATAKFPKRSLRVFVEARNSEADPPVPFLYLFAEPVTDKDIKAVQEKKKGAVESFRRRYGIVRGKEKEEVESAAEEAAPVAAPAAAEQSDPPATEAKVTADDSADIWEDMMEVVEDTMNKDAEGTTAIRDAIKEALEQSGLLQAKSSEESERYVEALLKSIVDTDSEPIKDEEEPEAEVSEEPVIVEPVAPEAPKKSIFGSVFSWFSSAPEEPEVSAKKSAQEQTKTETAPVPASENKDTTKDLAKEDADTKPSPELVELLLKLTSRVGKITKKGDALTEKAQHQEPSDDQANIQSFKRILSELIPEAVETIKVETEAGAKDTPGTKHSSASTAPKVAKELAPKELFGMVVSVRNKVNSVSVDRPTNLKRSDKWDIEYAVEELESEKAEALYISCQKRRRKALDRSANNGYQDPSRRAVVQRTMAGRVFRQQENEITRGKPVWIVGQHEPLPAEEVWTGSGAKLEHVLPSLDVPRPTAGEFPTELDYDAPWKPKPSSPFASEDVDFPSGPLLPNLARKDSSKGPAFSAVPSNVASKTPGSSKDDSKSSEKVSPNLKSSERPKPLGVPTPSRAPTPNPTSFKPPKTTSQPPFLMATKTPQSRQVPEEAVGELLFNSSSVSADEQMKLQSWMRLAMDNAAADASEGARKEDGGKEDGGDEDAAKENAGEKDTSDKNSIARSLGELRKSEETKAMSFKEWREKSKRKEAS